MKYKNIREEELKNKVGNDWFKQFDSTEILGNIDFTVFPKQDSVFGRTPLLWAEAKTGNYDIPTMFVQLILTIGKARTFDKTLPPAFLGAFDFKKIAFVDYVNIQDIFYLNDFNWNVTPSNHETKEFQLIKERIEAILKAKTYVFDYEKDAELLNNFIKNNVAKATTKSKIKIDKNNFIPIYLRWIEIVKPIIDVDWDELKKANIFDNDFYLADLFVDDKDTQKIDDDLTIRDNLFVVFQNQGYKIDKEDIKGMFDATINIRNKDAYMQFWKIYKRPPLQEFQDYIIERRDLLVPQDIRERKGAFFTPRIWVELSQKYITDYLGEDWQDEYYIWDCAAGTGNLLAGLRNKYNIYASTLDQADVNVMHERIDHGANLLKNHVFQFDFLNDDFTKLPQSLQDIINDPEKRKKLIIYINPPYAEASNAKTNMGSGENRTGISNNTKVYEKYQSKIGTAARELFAQFLIRIYDEIPKSKIANFSKLKNLQSSNFRDFRKVFKPKLERIFLTPANTFDNVKGKFPIGFFIFETEIIETFDKINADVYNKFGDFFGSKYIYSYKDDKYIIEWLRNYYDKEGERIAYLRMIGTDMQNNRGVFITNKLTKNDLKKRLFTIITAKNVIEMSIYNSVRHIFQESWLNDRDQFLFPNDAWQTDTEFQNDCLTFCLFDNSNSISSRTDTNHWIPFTEQEANAQSRFESHFMTDFINGKIEIENEADLFGKDTKQSKKREFSEEATAVFDAGRELWKYYHSQPNVNVNASFYDIRAHFQGRNDKGRMNSKSDDEKYMELIGELRDKLNFLADKIKPKIYEYGFLKE
ncbi:MAG: hypothetical protein CVV25_14010 [Ignavibacteriae bacterium HGW-Ignavibacteriae-4]|jgi:hypothetical protein|nr:MAG: hypothetical protein CVV25_14010 [Ignavibacteriae bacterium HGW-Ignavibacteriae-4]